MQPHFKICEYAVRIHLRSHQFFNCLHLVKKTHLYKNINLGQSAVLSVHGPNLFAAEPAFSITSGNHTFAENGL